MSEHLFNVYLAVLLQDTAFNVQTAIGKASKLSNPKGGSAFQIDARIYSKLEMFAVFYDGGRGHKDTDISIAVDVRRRQALCDSGIASAILVHRHGMSGIADSIGSSLYFEVVTAKRASILSGVKGIVEKLTGETCWVPFSTIAQALTTSEEEWAGTPGRNLLSFSGVLEREIKALKREGYIL